MPGRGTIPGRAEAGMCLECSWIAKETGQPEEGREGLETQADDRGRESEELAATHTTG